jgi:hypothetical protein
VSSLMSSRAKDTTSPRVDGGLTARWRNGHTAVEQARGALIRRLRARERR